MKIYEIETSLVASDKFYVVAESFGDAENVFQNSFSTKILNITLIGDNVLIQNT
jgi:hypothetical protein